MASSPTPTDYRPQMGSSAQRFCETKDTTTYPNQGSSKFDATPTADPAKA